MVPANTMLLAFVPIAVFAQWAVWAARRGARSQVSLALALVGVGHAEKHQVQEQVDLGVASWRALRVSAGFPEGNLSAKRIGASFRLMRRQFQGIDAKV
jgi:hypothetical protein